MCMLSRRTLSIWISFFRLNNFTCYGFDNLKKLIDIQINHGFMMQMQKRWDPCTHTFRFGNHEMCPTVEEFKAILGVPHEETLHLKWNTTIRPILKQEFGFNNQFTKSMTPDKFIDIKMLCTQVMTGGMILDNEAMRLVAIVVILAHFLLSPDDGKPSKEIFHIAVEMKKYKKDPTSIILAETLLGLDKIVGKNRIIKQGSPLLLQIWLMDKLGLLEPPSTRFLSLQNQMERLSKVKRTKFSKDFFNDHVTPSMIRSTMPWYCIEKMAYSMEGVPIILLLGLNEMSFYIPGRIPQQFGLPIVPLMPKGTDIYLPKFTIALDNLFPIMWKSIQHIRIINQDEEEDEDNIVNWLK